MMKKCNEVQRSIAVLCAVFALIMVGCVKKTESGMLTASVSKDCEVINIILSNCNDYGSIRFLVWSEKHGKDDAIWYSAQKDDDNWITNVLLKNHCSNGLYQIQAYGAKEYEEELLCTSIAYVAFAVDPDLTAKISDDCETMTITLRRHSDYNRVHFPTWSEENGQDDIVWYSAQKDENGNWLATIELVKHHSSGIYNIHAYGTKENEEKLLCITTVSVAETAMPDLLAEVSDDCETMTITLRRHSDYDKVRFPVWSEENGQDDIVWYSAQKDENGNWLASVELVNHHSSGIYNIHAYGTKESEEKLLCIATVSVAETTMPDLSAEVSDDCETMTITLRRHSDYDKVRFPVWSEENGQDDIVWYSAQKDENGNWLASVELVNHHSSGIYNIHAYGTKESEEKLLCITTVSVAEITMPDLSAEVSDDCETMTITLRRHSDYDKVRFPVWSEENGQDDIVWYSAQRDGYDNWIVVVSIKEHHSIGLYHIHVYGTKDAEEKFLCSTTAMVRELVPTDS